MNNVMQFFNHPLFVRAQQMAKNKSPEELRQIAANICKEKGLNMQQMYEQFQLMFNNK
jgi:CRISPR/Cas system-associated endonuclease Cas1